MRFRTSQFPGDRSDRSDRSDFIKPIRGDYSEKTIAPHAGPCASYPQVAGRRQQLRLKGLPFTMLNRLPMSGSVLLSTHLRRFVAAFDQRHGSLQIARRGERDFKITGPEVSDL